jgi:hypothetical protein
VFGLKNEPLTGIQVHVSSTAGFNQPSVSGSNANFGQAGWMVQVGSAPNNQTYTVEVQRSAGTISPKVQITFPGLSAELGACEFRPDQTVLTIGDDERYES